MNARKAMKLGIDMLSENRKDEGLALPLSIRQNMSLAALKKFSSFGFLKLGKEKAAVNTQIDQMALKCHDLDQEAQALSGGNQQKIAIGRLLVNGADILLLDEPTRGVDVGSTAEI